jgi:hypothetical protein
MGVEIDISNNLVGETIAANHMLSSFDAQNELLDNILDNELYNQELYNGGIGERYGNVGTDVNNVLYDIVNSSTNFDISNIDQLSNIDISNVSMSYNKTSDMYRNQKAVDFYVEGKKNKFQKRNKHLLQDVDNKIRQKEIYTYYYKKYNAQKKILMNIIVASLLTIVLTYLNKSYKFLLTDTLFILALGIIFATIVINICIQLFDILFRNNINYDEYDFMFNIKGNMLNTDNEKERQNCDAEIKAYQGR